MNAVPGTCIFKNSQKNLTEWTYMNGAADEGLVAVAMLHLDKELLLLCLIALDVDRFIDSTCEVLQGISRMTSSQCLIATSESEEKRTKAHCLKTTSITLGQQKFWRGLAMW